MRIVAQLHRMGLALARASCCLVAAYVLAAGIPMLSSVARVAESSGASFLVFWGIADAQAAKKPAKEPKITLPPPKAPPVVVFKPAATTKTTQKSNKNDDDDDKKNDKKDDKKSLTDKRPSDDDDDDQPKSADKSRSDASTAEVTAIPSTVQALFKQWFAPAPPVLKVPAGSVPAAAVVTGSATTRRDTAVISAGKPVAKSETASDAAAAAAAAKALATVKAAEATKGRRPTGGDLTLRTPLVPQTQILARNLTAATLKSATALGMKVKSSRTFDVIGSSVTQLVVPPHMDIAQARAALQQLAPDTALSFNQQYRLYPQAKEESARASLEAAKPSGGCSPERCYGALTIGWQGNLGGCARDLKIGVIDTGIDGSHPALNRDPERINYGTIGPEKRVPGNDLHGTGVLALLAGDPKSSTPGLVPRAKFYVADIFFADESGHPVSTTLHLLEALDWMERLQVQIINLSLSGPSDDLVRAAIARMSRTRTVDGVTRSGAIFIAAAGNGGPGAPPSYPAAYAEVLAVTAVGRDLRSYRRANQGDYIDVAAPGVDIWTALPDGRQGFQTGTSFAAPYVTAVVASIYRTLPSRVRSKTAILQRMPIQDLGSPGPDRVYGRGLVNAPASCEPEGSKSPVASRRVPVTKVSAN